MHFVNECMDEFHRCIEINTVAQIEDMTALADRTIGIEHETSLFAHRLLIREKHGRIKIALKGDPVLHLFAGTGKVHRPVESHGVSAAGGDILQPLSRPS